MEIKVFKLDSGEELIARVEPSVQTLVDTPTAQAKIKISTPMVLAPMQDRNGSIVMTFMPWLWSIVDSADKTVELNMTNVVLTPFEPPKPVIDAYLERTSGITLASGIPGRISEGK